MYSSRLSHTKPYVPGEQPRDRRYVKLNTNENPYPPSPKVGELLRNYDLDGLRRYPDPLFYELRSAAAGRYGLDETNVFAGNGSDEILSFSFFAFFDKSVAFASPSYSFYPTYCDFYGIRGVAVPLDEGNGIDLEDIAGRSDVDGIVVTNPNSPTGTCLEYERIESVMETYPRDRVVVIDEAYIAFGGTSVVPLVEQYDNLLVVHTFSKWASLAGLRLGLAFGNVALIDALFRTKDSFNSYPVHDIAQRIGVAALADSAYYEAICAQIAATREKTTSRLESTGWSVAPSKANFIFVRHPTLSGKLVYETLKANGVLVRHFDSPELAEYLRISIGTDREMDRCIDELERIKSINGSGA